MTNKRCFSRSGNHQWGTLRFTTDDRKKAIQRCRYCPCLWVGEDKNGRWEAELVYPKTLENSSSEEQKPNLPRGTRSKDLQVSDINTETGIISTPEPNNEGSD